MKYLLLAFSPFLLFSACRQNTDEVAEKMLLYQRSNGGWPQYKGDATNYDLPMTDSLKVILLDDKNSLDATIGDRSTTAEIRHLLTAFGKTKNPAYLEAAEHGIAYLLEAQNEAGGWPQWYPRSDGYHTHITFNDNAMIDVMKIMKGLSKSEVIFQPIKNDLKKQATTALEKGIECILKTQIRQNGKLTVWCAQHDSRTLLPAQARAFEPPSLSGAGGHRPFFDGN